MGRKKKNIVHENLSIIDISSEGLGIAKADDKVIFVESAMPGDVVSARVFQKRKRFDKARITELHTESPDRIKPFCAHYDLCGGCKWQHIEYNQQKEYKHKIVQDAFERLAKVPVGEVLPIVGALEATAYRNKMEYTFSASRWLTDEEINGEEILDKRALGLHVPGNYAKVVDIETCHLPETISNDIRNAVNEYARENDLSFFDIMAKQGFLRNIIVRTTTTGQLLVLLIFAIRDYENIEALMQFLQTKFPQITSLNYLINGKRNDSYSELEVINVAGEEFITEKMGDYEFKIRPKSFFQTNPKQAVRLYDVVKDFAGLQKDDILYDLYSGVGSIGIYLSDACKKVIGIEQIDQAVEDAKENASMNNIANAHYYVGDVRMLLNDEFLSKNEQPDVLVTDPPRAGMHEDVINTLLEAAVPKIVYVSCNPSTQARDIALLSAKYTVEKMQAVDMFPQTVHIENVALLTLKEEK